MASPFFNGTLDEVGLYPYAFTATQVTALYGARSATASTKALAQARAASLRSKDSRSAYFNTMPILTINGTNVMASGQKNYGVRRGTLKIKGILSDQPNTASFVLFDTTNTIAPRPGMAVVIADGAVNNKLLTGTIVRCRRLPVPTPIGTSSVANLYDISVNDGTYLIGRRTVTKQYAAGQSTSLVVLDIISTFTTGFTTGNVQSGAPSLSAPLSFKGITVPAALSQVGRAISPNWIWKVDANSDVHYFLTETSQAPTPITPGLFNYNSLDLTFDLTQIRTRILAEGGGGATTAPVAIGSASIAVDECAWYSASGGTVVSSTQEILVTYTGRSAASGPGSITGIPASGAGSVSVALTQGDQMNVWVQQDDAAAQAALALLEGGDGVHEFFLSVSGGTIAQATQAALAELAAYKTQLVTGTVWSLDRQMTEGKALEISLPLVKGVQSVSTIIQQVDRSLYTPTTWQFKVTYGTLWRNIVDVLKRVGQAA